MTAASRTVRAPQRVLFTPLPDGGVLLDLETKVYFTLNATGAELWALLSRGAVDRTALASHLSEQFEVDREAALQDVDEWIAVLRGEGLLDE